LTRDDDIAIRGLERSSNTGTKYSAIVWSSFWWREHHSEFAGHLRANSRYVLNGDRLALLDLRAGPQWRDRSLRTLSILVNETFQTYCFRQFYSH
jgi:hypothetical protein